MEEKEEELEGEGRLPGGGGDAAGVPSPGTAAEETTSAAASGTGKPPPASMHQDLLPEMLRLKLYVER